MKDTHFFFFLVSNSRSAGHFLLSFFFCAVANLSQSHPNYFPLHHSAAESSSLIGQKVLSSDRFILKGSYDAF